MTGMVVLLFSCWADACEADDAEAGCVSSMAPKSSGLPMLFDDGFHVVVGDAGMPW